jgi:hypothetical protein
MLCCLSVSLTAQQEENLNLKKKINLHVREQSLGSVLGQITEQTKINFSYDPSILNTDQLISAEYADAEVDRVLSAVLGKEFQYRMLGDQCIITLKKTLEPRLANRPVSASPGILKIAGKITDAESGEVIPYASVSVRD